MKCRNCPPASRITYQEEGMTMHKQAQQHPMNRTNRDDDRRPLRRLSTQLERLDPAARTEVQRLMAHGYDLSRALRRQAREARRGTAGAS